MTALTINRHMQRKNSKNTPRQWTNDEVRDKFLKHVAMLTKYWDTQVGNKTSKEKLEGLAFSILSTIDGCNYGLCGFQMIPHVHPDDKEYNKENGDNWYPPPTDNKHDIAGGLHELIHKYMETK